MVHFARILLPLSMAALGMIAPARAEGFKLGEDPASVILKWRPTTPDPEVKDFVKASRPADDQLKYNSLNAPKQERPKLKTKDEMNAMVKGLDEKGAMLKGRGAVFDKTDAAGLTRSLGAAAAESRRRAAVDFAVKPAR